LRKRTIIITIATIIAPSATRSVSSFAIGVDRSEKPFRGFLPRKTTPRDLYQATVIAKLL
jgi:hypothetical protein